MKKGDLFECTAKTASGWQSTHYRIDKIAGTRIMATPFKWGKLKGEIVAIGNSRIFTAGPKGTLPAACVKVRVR